MKADVSGRNRTLNGRTPSNGYFPPALCVSHPPPRTHSPPPLMIPRLRRYFHLHALIHIHFRCTSLPTSFRNLGSDNNNRWPPFPSPPLSLFRYRFSSPSISPGRDFLGRPDEKECARAIEVITRLQEARVSGRRGPREYLRER